MISHPDRELTASEYAQEARKRFYRYTAADKQRVAQTARALANVEYDAEVPLDLHLQIERLEDEANHAK